MDHEIQKSCWGFTMWTVATLGGVMALLYVFAGAGS
ncbi:hypothetical protein PSE_3817 [Pseudovibrio sp. FO-BEG1]|nr:hypothetical protein PSE_3817 [Pseudovibrio sp. FO-BEG1]